MRGIADILLSFFYRSVNHPKPASANTLVKVDQLAPVQASIDKTHGTAFRAAEVGANVAPISGRQVAQLQPTVMVASLMVTLRSRRSEAVDEHRLETGRTINGAVPIAKMGCGFSAPRHGASKRRPNSVANYQWAVARNRRTPLPVAGVGRFR
jgi:hypothetical protein